MTLKLEGKVALITGSGRGIGRSIALKLASEGARVVVNDLDAAPAQEVVDEIRKAGGHAVACVGSVSAPDFAERFVGTVGEPPLHYVTRWRLTIADDLIRSGGLKVTQAAQRVGYASDAAFSRAFKAHFGRSPSEVRR